MTDETTAAAFLDLLVAAVENNQARIVITLRADFLDRPLLYSEFGELLGDSVVTLRSPSPDELGEAIVGPAQGVGVAVDAGLAERMTSEVHDRPGALPLLQHALVELFESRTSDQLDLDLYDQLGGVIGSLAKRAESVFGDLKAEQQQGIKQVFLRLVTVVDDSAPTRRRVRMNELEDLDASDPIDAFTRSRLLVLDTDPDTRTPTVEVAHEALLSHWPRFAGWIDATREDLALSRRLEESIREWEGSERDPAYLLTGGRLAQHQAWSSTTSLVLGPLELEYLQASMAHEEAVRIRSQRVRRLVMAGFAAAAVGASVLGLVALQNSRTAQENEQLALAKGQEALENEQAAQDAAELAVANEERAVQSERNATAEALAANAITAQASDPQLALLLAAEAYRQSPSQVAISALHQGLQGNRQLMVIPPPEGSGGAAGIIDPDGSRVAVLGYETNIAQ